MSGEPLVLIVDDEPQIRRLLHGTLSRAGYRVTEAATARETLHRLSIDDPAVVLLDLGLPDRDGMELLPLIAKPGGPSILVVSARDATDEKVAALDLGAADYVTKPFDTDELLARVRATLRHRLTAEGGRAQVTIGELAIDLTNHRVTMRGREVHLTPKEFELLAQVARFPGRAITHQQLLSAIWKQEHERHIEYLRVMIRNLRQKLEANPTQPKIIVSELGIGYRLMGATD